MKNVKNWILGGLLSAGLLFTGISANAQNKTPEQRADARTEKMIKNLNLDANQGQQVKEINLDAAHQIAAVRADNTLSKDAKKAKIKAIRKDANGKIKNLLTPEQRQKARALHQQRRANHQAGMKGKHMHRHK